MQNSKISIGPRALTYPNPVLVVCTYDEKNNPNMMTASWIGVCCSEPPCIAVSIRKQRKTFSNIELKKAFTINIPSTKYVREVDYAGIYSGTDRNKFEILNLTEVKAEFVDAPYILEFPVILECELIKSIDLGSHTQFIGKILDIKADTNITSDKKAPSVLDVLPFVYDSGTRSYYSIGEFIGEAYKIGLE
jgi:flavin reductase (DIM6/NTAB) family NADH-FMN oxidoreductase RutF